MKKIISGGEIGREMKSAVFPTKEDLDVAQILLDFSLSFEPHLSLLDYIPDDSNWKRKKRRSCLDPIPIPIPPLPPIQNEIKAQPTAAKGGGDHRTTTSPDTPLLLNRSSEKTSRKRKKYLNEIAQLTQQKCLLQMEKDNVQNYCNKLKAYNAQLKAMKQEVTVGKKVEIGLMHHPPFVADPKAKEIQFPIGPIRAHSHSQPSSNAIGFDLNVPPVQVVDEVQPLDMNRRVRYAEARRMRKGLMKKKSIKKV